MLKIFRLKCLVVISLFSCLNSNAQFRVIGYIHPHIGGNESAKIDFQKLTHLNIAFVNPDSMGQLLLPPGFDSLIEAAHLYKVKVLASIGGGSHNPYYAALKDENRAAFVQKIIKLTSERSLDGIDVDIENDNIDDNYVKLVTDLSSQLKPLKKLLTSAVATWNGERIPDAALSKFDFINVMSYDETGPWKPEKPGPHSSFEKAENDLLYWSVSRKISSEKINLGVPFYGYCFGTKYNASMPYKEIISNFPGAEEKDVIMPEGGGAIYYNGLATIKNKTKLALKKAGGIMIWELMQDSDNQLSLLSCINNVIKQK